VVACLSSFQTITATAVYVNIGGSGTSSTVPYFEGFENLGADNDLPNCSWAASSLGSNCLTFTSSPLAFAGNGAAAFAYNGSSVQEYFYTEGIQLNAGVMYSTTVWYTTGSSGSNIWSDLSLVFNNSQS